MTTTDASLPVETRIPLIEPPPGVTSNFDNPDSLAKWSHVTIAVCVPVATVFFLCRTYVRGFIKWTWTLEDWLVTVGWFGTAAYCGVMAGVMANHGGVHAWDLTAIDSYTAQYWFNTASVVYGVVICVVKLAILTLFRRVFCPTKKSPLDIAILSVAAACVLFYGSTSLVKIFECSPRQKIFDRTIPGTCVDIPVLLNVSGLFNTITDFLILFIPIKAVWRLQIPKQQKAIVILAFTFGVCAPVFSLIGFIVRLKISSSRDNTWHQPEILLWGAAEITTCLLCVCFPEVGGIWHMRRLRRERHQASSAAAAGSGRDGLGVSRSRAYGKDTFGGERLGKRNYHVKGESQNDLTGSPADGGSIELNEEPRMYTVDIQPVRTREESVEEGQVHVRHEVVIT